MTITTNGNGLSVSLDNILQEQYAQQERIFGHRPMSVHERQTYARDIFTALIGETADYLKVIGGNRLMPEIAEQPREARVMEIVDLMKCVLALAWTEDIQPRELELAFQSKTRVLDYRRNAELRSTRVAAFDIDGVVCDLKGSGWSEEDSDRFFNEGDAQYCRVVEYAARLVRLLHELGWSVVFVTSRKRWRHPNLEFETYHWLNVNDIPFDRVLFAYDKTEALRSIGVKPAFYLDDSPKHALDVASSGILTFLLGSQVEHPNVICVNNLLEVIDHLSREKILG